MGVAAVVLACALAAVAEAQPIDDPKTYAGDLWSRPRLTGDWGGFRDDLAKRGVRFDADLLLTPQGVASGGHDTGARFWGNTEYTLDVDTGKGGLWPGGFLGRRGVEPRLRTLRRGVSGGRRRCEVGVGRESGLDGGRRADVESGVATG